MELNTVLIVLAQIGWLFLPAGFANMAPVLFKRIPVLSTPVDFGRTFRGKRITGDHKTYRGIVSGVLFATIVAYVQMKISVPAEIVLWPTTLSGLCMGLILGGGGLIGDSVKSFFKRQIGIKDGAPWFPFDQIDWVLGVFVALALFGVILPVHIYVVSIILALIVHPLVNLLGYYLGLKKNKF
jgi:CDP-2,3-bis-(O-geranylgeranyl)-sn-glycerol synthase